MIPTESARLRSAGARSKAAAWTVLAVLVAIALSLQLPALSAQAAGPDVSYIPPAFRVTVGELPSVVSLSRGGVPAGTGPPARTLSGGVLTSFEGLNHTQFGANPPDVAVAAGPSDVVELVNFAVGVYAKNGTLLSVVYLRDFFAATNTIFDPRILFDAPSGRWFASGAEYNGSSDRTTAAPVRVAVSSSSDPLGAWTIYLLVGGGDPDQPFIGVSDDTVVVSSNGYYVPNSRYFRGSEHWVVNKAQMVAGVPAAFTLSAPDPYVLTVNPVDSQSPTTTEFMVGRLWRTSNKIRFYAITGVPGVSTVSEQTSDFTVSRLRDAPDAVQAGTSSLIETNCCENRILDASWRTGHLWFTMHVACKPAGERVTRACLRLVELDTGNPSRPTVLQDFDYGQSARYLFYPALSIDGSGNLAVVYGFSSATEYPSLAVTGQAAGGPANTLMTPVTLRAGSAPHLSSRYGDYFGAATDPSDPSVVWVAGEYNKTMPNGRWATYIGAITVSAGLAPNGIAPPIRSNLLGRTTGGDLGSPSTPPVAVGLSAPAMRTVAPRRPHGSLT